MQETQKASLQYFVLIAEQKKKDKYLKLLSSYGARGISTVYGQGSMSSKALAAAFGLGADRSRAVITCLLKTEKAKELITILYKDHNFNKPNTGIAFCVSVEGLAF